MQLNGDGNDRLTEVHQGELVWPDGSRDRQKLLFSAKRDRARELKAHIRVPKSRQFKRIDPEELPIFVTKDGAEFRDVDLAQCGTPGGEGYDEILTIHIAPERVR